MYHYHILHNDGTYNENVADTKTSRRQLSYGGRPNISGLNSFRESSTKVARCWCVCVLIPLWGVQTHCIPAARAASTPLGASSNTKTCNLNINNFSTGQEKEGWIQWICQKNTSPSHNFFKHMYTIFTIL